MSKKDRYSIEIEHFANKLKALRALKKMTQLSLAEEMNIERSEISKMENGKLNVEFRTLVKLAIALDIEMKTLFE